MPRYRINYIARTTERPFADSSQLIDPYTRIPVSHGEIHETQYKDEIDGRTPAEALDAFFWQHVERREDVMIKGTDGVAHEIEGVADFDPEIAYLWIENGEMMEYQGLEEMTPGTVICPMCNGSGEIDENLVDFYEEIAAEESANA